MFKIPLFQSLKTDQWVKPFLHQYKKALYLALFLGFMTFFCAGALMFTSGYLISRSASLPENILMIYIPIVLTRAFGIGRPVFRYVERLTSHNWVLKMTSKLRLKLYLTLEKEAMFFKQTYRMGDILGLLAEDINHIQNLYLRTIFPTIIAWILYVFVIVGLGFFSLWFALVMTILFFGLVVVFPLVSVLMNGARQEREKQVKNALYIDLTDNVMGVSDWIFSQRSQEYVASYLENEQQLYHVQNELRRFNRLRNYFFQLYIGLMAVSLILWTSQRFVGNHGGAANWIAAFVLSLFPLIDAFAVLPDAAQETNVYKDSLNRLNALNSQATPEDSALPIQTLTIQLKNLSFHYPNESKMVLNGLDLTIPQGQKLAILGRSGSGKSTLATLIRGDLAPTDGFLTLGEVPTNQFGDQIANYIGVIQQTPYLFHTTILNNLRIGNEEASVEEVWHVLERVGLKKLVQRLPDGLQTMVDEAGLRFSGGERHRMALARILLQDTPIVLLDEPTVGLDPITEQALIDTFFGELKDKTIIWITHHLQGINQMERVLFIENGQIELAGSPAELAATSPRYRLLKAVDEGR
ncbi:thiol reductant ABC exporter subunit CydC [Enterococcus camelliae]|uniref:Thiol reductant ABC exporter subunit CydC n=1 Tax=Enterococcus camelliae TaxID=453959 RepID=A0ABW5TG76_9ENTE